MSVANPLDNPIWSALTTGHVAFAEGDAAARRYPADIGPFAGMIDTAPASYAALRRLIVPPSGVALFTADPLVAPDDLEPLAEKTVEQMIAGPIGAEAGGGPALVPLGAADLEAMLALVELARPGPFSRRTPELGHFLGIRADGRLVAMAGERMKLDGHTEITAVCTHPDHRGHGYARALLAGVARGIVARGDTPFLHVFSDNQSAIEVYLRSGFTIRKRLHLTVLGRRSSPDARDLTPE